MLLLLSHVMLVYHVWIAIAIVPAMDHYDELFVRVTLEYPLLILPSAWLLSSRPDG